MGDLGTRLAYQLPVFLRGSTTRIFFISLSNCTYVISPAETVFVQKNVNLHSFGDKDNDQRFSDERDEFGVCKIPVFNLWLSIVMNILDLGSFRSPE